MRVVDEHRIRQVLDNLLSNAIKYGGTGGSVTVCLRQEADGVGLEVSDTGLGIAADEVEHVFGRFFRGGEALERHIAGTGLGLNIVSTIVAAHEGAVDLDSELGPGQHLPRRPPLWPRTARTRSTRHRPPLISSPRRGRVGATGTAPRRST